MDWFLYVIGLRQERVKGFFLFVRDWDGKG